MSLQARDAVYEHSSSRLSTRQVLLVIAEAAQGDGISWLLEETIAARVNVDVRTVRRAIAQGVAAGELETRDLWEGRVRRNVYRLLLPGLDPPNEQRITDLGYRLSAPFTTGQVVRPSEADDRTNTTATTGQSVLSRGRGSSFSTNRKRENRKEKDLLPAAREGDDDEWKIAFDHLAAETRANPSSEGGRIGKALKQILAYHRDENCGGEDGICEAITEHARLYRQRWPQADLTPTALANQWHRVSDRVPGNLTAEEIRAQL